MHGCNSVKGITVTEYIPGEVMHVETSGCHNRVQSNQARITPAFQALRAEASCFDAACSLPSKHKWLQPCRLRIQIQLLLLDFKHPGLNLCTQSARYQRDTVSPCNPTLQLISRSHSLAHRETCGVVWCGRTSPLTHTRCLGLSSGSSATMA